MRSNLEIAARITIAWLNTFGVVTKELVYTLFAKKQMKMPPWSELRWYCPK